MLKPFFSVLFLLLLASCNSRPESSPELVGTIRPWALLLKQVAGGRFTVGTFTPPGASPHTYAPAPADIRKLEKAKLILANGLGLEEGLTRKLRSMGNRVAFAAAIPGLNLKHQEDDHHVHGHHGVNPHLWTDPDILIRVTIFVRDRLIALDPAGKPVFIKHARALIDSLKAADRQIREERKQYREARVITFHDAFAHFRRRYSIELVATVAESPGKQPSSKELLRIGRRIKKRPARVIFIEPQLNPKAARVLAREFGLKVAVLDPLGATSGVRTPAEHLLSIWNGMKPYFTRK